MRLKKYFMVIIILCFIAPQAIAQIHDARTIAIDPTKAKTPIAPILKGLGDYHFPVTTQNPA